MVFLYTCIGVYGPRNGPQTYGLFHWKPRCPNERFVFTASDKLCIGGIYLKHCIFASLLKMFGILLTKLSFLWGKVAYSPPLLEGLNMPRVPLECT